MSRFLPCGCVLCGSCMGSGRVWEYDALSGCDELERCDDCDGSGKSEHCEECMDYDDEAYR